MDEFLYDIFRQRLIETIAWCMLGASPADPANCLRTPALRPQPEADTYHYGLLSEGSTVVSRIGETRLDLLGSTMAYADLLSSLVARHLTRGRLLLYQPAANYKDGLGEAETNGFLDAWDTPPWDTWIWFTTVGRVTHMPEHLADDGLLVCWIPSEFVEVAQRGMNVEAYGSLKWADEAETPLTHVLRTMELIGA